MTTEHRCAKCGSNRLTREQFEMYGSGSKGHRFDVVICENCNYSEFYFKRGMRTSRNGKSRS
ncbi:MAG: zinc ribbon domain-containing protein [Candidatus Bathyarchaeia archaeon]